MKTVKIEFGKKYGVIEINKILLQDVIPRRSLHRTENAIKYDLVDFFTEDGQCVAACYMKLSTIANISPKNVIKGR